MRWAIIVLILLGVLAAVCAALLVATLGGGSKNAQASQVDLVVASKALSAMTTLDAGMVSTRNVARKEAPTSYFTNAVQVVGRMLIVPIADGQVLTPECFGDRESGAKLASTIPSGKVAVSISLKDYSSLEGLLYPGCLVDVNVTLKQTNEQASISITLMQGVEVIAIEGYTIISPKHEADSVTAIKGGGSRRVTLLLTTKQAKAVQLAMENGSVSLALRNPTTPSTAEGETYSMDEMLRKEKVKNTSSPTLINDPTEPLPSGWEMVLIQGGVKESRSLPKPPDN